MYRSILFVLFSLLLVQNIKSQSLADTVKVRALHKKASSLWANYPDSMLLYIDRGVAIANQIDDRVGLADLMTVRGIYYWVKGNYVEAINSYQQAIDINVGLKRPVGIAKNIVNLGMVYSKLGDYPKAIQYLKDALHQADQLDEPELRASAFNSLGVAYKNYGNFEEALQAFEKSLPLFSQAKKFVSVAGTYTNMGNIFLVKGDVEKSLNYHNKSLVIFDSLKIIKGQITCYNNLASAYQKQQKLDEALKYRLLALELSRKQGFPSNEVEALIGLAEINQEQSNFKEAEKYYREGIAVAQSKGSRQDLMVLYKGLAETSESLKKFDEAMLLFKKHIVIKDSIFNQQSLASISNLRISFEIEKKEADIKILKKDKEIDALARTRIIIGGVAILLISVVIVARQRLKIKSSKQLMAQHEELHRAQQALSKMELHTARQKEEELQRELEYKNKSLTTYALNMVQKNEILSEVRDSVELILKTPQNQAEQFNRLSRLIDYTFTLDKDWDDFKMFFEYVHQDFFNKLKVQYPDLSIADIKLCALIRLNLNMKQSASILRISPDSVKIARHRLRKKFNLNTEDNLTQFIASI